MKTITTILLLIVAVSTAKAQKKEIDYKLYAKIESGQYSTQAYLKGLIEKKYVEKDFETFFSKNDFKGLLAEGLINSIISKDYKGKYQMAQYFEQLKYYEFQKTMYFYEHCAIRGNNELFIWGTYDSKADSFKIESRIINNIEPTFYEFEIKVVDGLQFILFKADELVVIGTQDNINWTTIKYNVPNDSAFIGTYRDCNIENDTAIKCERLQWKGKSDEILKTKRIFTTPLYINDLGNDGKLEFYWFAVSDGSLIHLESFVVIDKAIKLIENEKLIENLKTDPNFKKYIEISKMTVKPKT